MEDRCRFYMFQEEYEQYLQSRAQRNLGSTLVDAIPNRLMQEIEQVKLGLDEMNEELAIMNLGMAELKRKQPRQNCSCVVVGVLLVLVCLLWVVFK